MRRRKTGFLTAMLPLVGVFCISLAVVAGIITWVAAREGRDLGELVAGGIREGQSARPLVLQPTRLPTLTPPPSPTPSPTATATLPPVVTEAALPAAPPEQSANTQPISQSVAAALEPAPAADSQVVSVPESPIRPGSPLPERVATRLVIPDMDLDVPVVLAPIVNQTWEVEQLGTEYVGHLEGTASPGDRSNIVLAGHVTIAANVYGPFAGLGQLQPGASIIVYDGEQPYTYIVDSRKQVPRTAVDITFPTEEGRVTLITCTNWSDELGAYEQRLIVVGRLQTDGL